MNSNDFRYLADVLMKRSGLALTEDKSYLLESRLRSVARAHGQADLPALVNILRNQPNNEALLKEITEAMTTNESMFFRDTKPFDALKLRLLPAIKPYLRGGNLNVWCAACSSGQEPYSLAMMFEDEAELMSNIHYRILATDIDTQVLKRASDGAYSQFEVQRGLPIQLLLKHFEQQDQNNWQIKADLKQKIEFRYMNLLDNFASLGKFDVIMCRNVLIYFDRETKAKVLDRIVEQMNPYSLLFLGSSETVIGLTEKLKPLRGEPGVFVRSDASLAIV